MISFHILGAVSLRDADGEEIGSFLTGSKRVALLSYLALAPAPGYQRRDTLLALFWPEVDQKHARASLRNMLYQMRRSVGGGVIGGRGAEEVGLDARSVWCDAVAFDEALDEDRRADALELYRGDLLEGFFVSDASAEFEHWLDRERARIRHRAAEATRGLITEAEQEGNTVAALRWARRAAALDPFDERAARRLISLLDAAGDRAGALRVYEKFEERLALEFEAEPSAETRAVMAQILEREEAGFPPSNEAAALPGTEAPFDSSGAAMIPGAAGPPEHAEQRETSNHEDAPARRIPTPAAAVRKPSNQQARSLLRPNRKIVLSGFVSVVLLFLIALAGGWDPLEAVGGDPPPAAVGTLAVLPFETAGAGGSRSFADAVHEEVVARLGRVSQLDLLPEPRARRLQEGVEPLAESATRHGVAWLVQGDVQQVGDELQVNARLFDVRRARQVWSEEYRGTLTAANLFRIQSEIAEQIAAALEVQLTAEKRDRLGAVPTHSLAAYELHLQARKMATLGPMTRERIDRLTSVYQRAVELDPGYAEAQAGLPWTYVLRARSSSGDARATRTLADSAILAARRALELDPRLALAQSRIGDALWAKGAPVEERLAAYRKALELDPHSTATLGNLLVLLSFQGRWAEKMHWLEWARRQASTSNPRAASFMDLNAALGRDSIADAWLAFARRSGRSLDEQEFQVALFYRHDLRRARELLARMASDTTGIVLERRRGALALYEGDWKNARRQYRALHSGILGSSYPIYQGLLADGLGLAYALERLGQGEEASEIAAEIAEEARREIESADWNFIPWHRLAVARLILGDTTAALDALETATDAGFCDVRTMKTIPVLDPLRGHPRFQSLIGRMETLVAQERRRVERREWGLPPAVKAVTDRSSP